MNDKEKLDFIESIIPAYTAFIELLKYQKEKINNKVMWECYINELKKLMNKDLELIKEQTNER